MKKIIVLVVGVILFMYGLLSMHVGQSVSNPKDIVCAVSLFVGVLLVLWSFGILERTRYTAEIPRPIVCKWTHNGETIITSKEVYDLSLRMKEQLVKITQSSKPEKFRVRPFIYTIFEMKNRFR